MMYNGSNSKAEGGKMIDILATITPNEYRIIKERLEAEGLWNREDREIESNRRAEQILAELRK